MTTKNHELHVILGAGAVGLALMEALLARGKQVRIVNRSGVKALPAGVESCQGDVASLDFARKAGEGATHVYAALNAPYAQWKEAFPPLQKGALEAAATAGAK